MNISILTSIVGFIVLVIVFNVLLSSVIVILEFLNDRLLSLIKHLLLLGDLSSDSLGG